MSKRKPLDKAQIRERRDRMLEAAAAADLSLTEGVREMRAIAGMTQEEFARHRGVSARVIKALELGQGNPTVATLNRIGEFFGLEVAFVPRKRATQTEERPQPADSDDGTHPVNITASVLREINGIREDIEARARKFDEMLAALGVDLSVLKNRQQAGTDVNNALLTQVQAEHRSLDRPPGQKTKDHKKKTPPQ